MKNKRQQPAVKILSDQIKIAPQANDKCKATETKASDKQQALRHSEYDKKNKKLKKEHVLPFDI